MGQKQTNPKNNYSKTDLIQSMDKIFNNTAMVYNGSKISQSIEILMKQFENSPPLTSCQQGLHISKVIIRIFTNKRFFQSLVKLLKLFVQNIDFIVSTNNISIVHQGIWKSAISLGKFIMALTDERLWCVLNHLTDIDNYHQQTKQMCFNQIYQLVSKLHIGEVIKIQQSLSSFFNKVLAHRESILPIASNLKPHIQKLEEISFILYLKLYFSTEHHVSVKYQIFNSDQKYRECLKIASYFMMMGLSLNKASLYDLSIVYIQDLMDRKHYPAENCVIPPFLFKNIPTCLSKQCPSFICFYILINLKRSIKNQNYNFNRIMSYKVVLMLMSSVNDYQQQIQIILESLCRLTNWHSIERSYLSKIIQIFIQKKYRQQTSKILSQYHQNSKCSSYHICTNNNDLPIDYDTIVEALKTTVGMFKHYEEIYTEKYLYEEVFGFPLLINYSEKSLWSNVINYQLNGTCAVQSNQKQQSYNLSTDYLTKYSTLKTRQANHSFN